MITLPKKYLKEPYNVISDVALGEGTYGIVKLVRGTNSKLEFARKEIQLANTTKARVEREINVLSKCDQCEFVVSFVDCKIKDNVVFIIMELCGENLETILNDFEINAAETYFNSVALCLTEGVLFLRKHEIMHRDLKPNNIVQFIKGNNTRWKIADFGSARRHAKRSAKHTSTVGNKFYMAPEKISNNYSFQVDDYSIGIIFYDMLTQSLGETVCDEYWEQYENYTPFHNHYNFFKKLLKGQYQHTFCCIKQLTDPEPSNRPLLNTVFKSVMDELTKDLSGLIMNTDEDSDVEMVSVVRTFFGISSDRIESINLPPDFERIVADNGKEYVVLSNEVDNWSLFSTAASRPDLREEHKRLKQLFRNVVPACNSFEVIRKTG